MRQEQPSPHDSLGTAEKKFELWRKNRNGRGRIPRALWQTAVETAEEHGPSKTARVLRLDYYKLKERMGAPVERRKTRKDRRFLELPLFAPESCKSTFELEAGEGRRLRLVLEGAKPAELEGLARALWTMVR